MATANLNEPTSASDGNIPYIGATADDGTGNTLREAIDRINARLRELYGNQDGSNVVQTPFVDADNIKDGGVGTTQLAADAVNGTKIADDSIDSEHYVDGSIDTAHFSLTAAINVNVDQNSGTIQLWSGTQAQYDALTPDASTIYFIV